MENKPLTELTAIEKRRIRQNARYLGKKDEINAKRRASYLAKITAAIPEREWRFKTYDEVFARLTPQHKITTKSHLQSAFNILDTDNFEKTIQTAPDVIQKFRDADINANSKKSYFQALLIGKTDNEILIPEDALQKYLTFFEELKLDAYDITKAKKETEIIPEFGSFLELVKTKFGEFSKEYLLIKLYSEVTARDNFYLKIVRSNKETNDENQNFLIMPMNVKQTCKIVLNKFKTQGDKHPVVREDLTVDLSIGLRRYKNNEKLEYGDFIFNKLNGELVGRIFKSLGMTGNINTLRQMRASTSENLTNKEKAKLANSMMHSTNAQQGYIRKISK